MFRSGAQLILKRDPEQQGQREEGNWGNGEKGREGGEGKEGMSIQAPGTVNGLVRRCRKEGNEIVKKKNLIQIIFSPWALKCKSQIKEVCNGSLHDWERISSS